MSASRMHVLEVQGGSDILEELQLYFYSANNGWGERIEGRCLLGLLLYRSSEVRIYLGSPRGDLLVESNVLPPYFPPSFFPKYVY